MTSRFLADYGVKGERVDIIDNNSSQDALIEKLSRFVDIFYSEIAEIPLSKVASVSARKFPDPHILDILPEQAPSANLSPSNAVILQEI